MSKELIDRIQELLLENAALREDVVDLKEMCRDQFDRISLYGTRLNDRQEALKKILSITENYADDRGAMFHICEVLDDIPGL